MESLDVLFGYFDDAQIVPLERNQNGKSGTQGGDGLV